MGQIWANQVDMPDMKTSGTIRLLVLFCVFVPFTAVLGVVGALDHDPDGYQKLG